MGERGAVVEGVDEREEVGGIEEHSTQVDLEGLSGAIEALPLGQREVLLLRYLDDLPLGEIAEAMQLPLGTVKSRLHNALQTLKADPRLKTFELE